MTGRGRRRGAPVEVIRSSVVAAPRDALWERVTTPEGIADEFAPLLTMRMPPGLRDTTIAHVPLGRPLGRAWIVLAGVVPVEYDDLVVVDLDPPHHFRERSALGSCRVWEHRRELEALPDGATRVTDTLRAWPRALVPRAVARRVVGALFTHRHRRLARHIGGRPGP